MWRAENSSDTRSVFRSRDLSGPIRGQNTGHVTHCDQSQAMSERERLEYNSVREKEESSVKSEPGPASKKQRMMGLGGKNLLQIYRWVTNQSPAFRSRDLSRPIRSQ